MNFNVFNIEFDGIDKSGKDSIMRQIFALEPNKYIPKSRGLLSQIAYNKLYNRDYTYEIDEGYIKNTLFVYLRVDEKDWNVRCALTNEHEKNKNRYDMEGPVKYKSNMLAFESAYKELYLLYGNKYSDHFMIFNTSSITPINIITAVIDRLNLLNLNK